MQKVAGKWSINNRTIQPYNAMFFLQIPFSVLVAQNRAQKRPEYHDDIQDIAVKNFVTSVLSHGVI